jgi:hypothetical protein
MVAMEEYLVFFPTVLHGVAQCFSRVSSSSRPLKKPNWPPINADERGSLLSG